MLQQEGETQSQSQLPAIQLAQSLQSLPTQSTLDLHSSSSNDDDEEGEDGDFDPDAEEGEDVALVVDSEETVTANIDTQQEGWLQNVWAASDRIHDSARWNYQK